MGTAFTRTVRSLDADRFLRPGAGLLLCAAFLGAWGYWAARFPVTLREVTSTARIEVSGAAVPVQTPLSGRVARTLMVLGSEVREGDPMIELDAAPERLQLEEERTRADATVPTIAALRGQVMALRQAREREQAASAKEVEEAQANRQSSEAPARYAAGELARLEQLRGERLIAERDYQKARADADETLATVDRRRLTAERLSAQQATRESDREAAVRNLEAEIARLEAQALSARAAMSRLQNEAGRRVIRAPFAGRVGEAQVLRAGAYLTAGEKIAAIVPESGLMVVAQFAPAAALGRVREGQTGEARLPGFPWAQWGTVPLIVSRVSGEIREGGLRVELKIDPSRPCRIPLRHGIPGAVEVAVERLTPLELLLRSVGRMLSAPRSGRAS